MTSKFDCFGPGLTQLGSNYSSPVAVGTKRQTVLRQSESNCRRYGDSWGEKAETTEAVVKQEETVRRQLG